MKDRRTPEERQAGMIARVLSKRSRNHGLGGTVGAPIPPSKPPELNIPASQFKAQYPKPEEVKVIKGQKTWIGQHTRQMS